MVTCRLEISKEVYERSLEHNNHIAGSDELKVFGAEVVYGYGLYGTYTYEKDGKYWVRYEMGNSCD